MTTTHALVRTNEYGIPFVGTCINCGKENLPAAAARWECANTTGRTQEQSLLAVIRKGD